MKNRSAEIEKSFGAHFLMTFLCAVFDDLVRCFDSPVPRFSDKGHRDSGDGTAGAELLPASAEGFIEVDDHQLFVAHGVAQRHLSIEVVTLGIQKVQVTDDPVDVL